MPTYDLKNDRITFDDIKPYLDESTFAFLVLRRYGAEHGVKYSGFLKVATTEDPLVSPGDIIIEDPFCPPILFTRDGESGYVLSRDLATYKLAELTVPYPILPILMLLMLEQLKKERLLKTIQLLYTAPSEPSSECIQ